MPLRIVEAYRALAMARGVPIPPEYERAAAVGRRIEAAFLADPIELRPCHNDLLNANFIDDGTRIRIIDWEYAGMGDPFFDLGNFSINHELTPDEDEILLAAYDGDGPARPPRPADADAGGLRLPRGDVGRPPAGRQHARCRLRRVCRGHFDRLLRNAAYTAFERALARSPRHRLDAGRPTPAEPTRGDVAEGGPMAFPGPSSFLGTVARAVTEGGAPEALQRLAYAYLGPVVGVYPLVPKPARQLRIRDHGGAGDRQRPRGGRRLPTTAQPTRRRPIGSHR